MKSVREAVRERLDEVRSHHDDRHYAARALAALEGDAIPAAIEADARLGTIGGLEAVLDRAIDELRRDVNVALRLTGTVIDRSGLFSESSALLALRGRALRLHAVGLRDAGAVPRARETLREAEYVLMQTPAGALELEDARLFEAFMLAEAGRPGEALQLLRKAANGFAVHGDSKGLLRARITEGDIRFDCGAYAEAKEVFEDALPLAEGVRDDRNCAVVRANLGHCAARLGLIDAALIHFAHALGRFAALDLTAERQRILWAVAKLMVEQGRIEESLAQFVGVREEFLRRGMFLSAAFVALDAVEVLLNIGRRELVRHWCKTLIETFSSAGMPEYALRALAYLKESADLGRVDLQVLGDVRASVREHLPVDSGRQP